MGVRNAKPHDAAAAPDLYVGEHIRLRAVCAADLSAMKLWDEDPEIIALMGRKFQATEAEDWFQVLGRDRTCRALAVESAAGRLIGEVELAHLNWRQGSAEVRICIGEKDCWGQGYGTETLQVLMRIAFEGLGLRTIYLRVFSSNERAVRCYRRLGFRVEAKLKPSARREDPAPVFLMTLSRDQWLRKGALSA